MDESQIKAGIALVKARTGRDQDKPARGPVGFRVLIGGALLACATLQFVAPNPVLFIAMVFLAVPFGFAFAPLVRDLLSDHFPRFLREERHRGWENDWRAFDGCQLRVLSGEGTGPSWVVLKDMLTVLSLRWRRRDQLLFARRLGADARVSEDKRTKGLVLISDQSSLQWLKAMAVDMRKDHADTARRLMLYLEREVFTSIDTARTRKTGVVLPFTNRGDQMSGWRNSAVPSAFAPPPELLEKLKSGE